MQIANGLEIANSHLSRAATAATKHRQTEIRATLHRIVTAHSNRAIALLNERKPMLDKPETEKTIDPLMERAMEAHEAENHLAAAKIFEVAYRRDPSATTAILNMASSYYKAQHYPEAERAYKEALRSDANNAAAYYGLAMINEEIGDRPTARQYFKKSAELNPSSLKAWLSLAQVTLEDTARKRAIKRAVEVAQQSLKADDSSYISVIEAADMLFAAGKYGQAITAYQSAINLDPTSYYPRGQLARCYRKHNHNYFNAASTVREMIMNSKPPFSVRSLLRPQQFKDLAKKALIDIQKTLNDAGIKFFPVAGTLLGCMREHEPLANDRDVDIGILEDVSNQDIVETLRAKNSFACPLHYSKDAIFISVHHGLIPIDIFRHEASDGFMWCGISRHKGDMKWRYTPFDLKEKLFFDLPFYVPQDPVTYLRENYGAWEKPDPSFSSVLSSPARFDVSPDTMRYFAYSRMSLATFKKDPNHTRSIIGQTPDIVKEDRELIRRVIELSSE